MKRFRLFFTNPPLASRELTINGVGVQEKMPPRMVERLSGTADYLFMVFYDAVDIHAHGKLQRCAPGTIMLWEPRHAHIYGSTEKHWDHSWTHCDGRTVARVLKESGVPLNVPILLPDPWMCDHYLEDIHHELTHFAQPDAVIVENLLENWIREIARVARGVPGQQTVPKNFLALKAYIEANYELPLSLEQLASKIHLSVPHLCSQFKKHFGVSVIGYAIQLRLHQAAYLLQDRSLGVGEIARRVGYEDIYYFSKLFKDYYGASPRNARKVSAKYDVLSAK
jgi:AraC family transcriptional regulator, arabinose operon regulatory protein